MTKTNVFISYSFQGRDWAEAFARSVKHNGVEVWIDQWKVAAGQDWPAAFEKALRESDVVAIVVNPAEPFRPDLFFEVGAAIGMGKRLVPIVPRGLEPSALPDPLRVRQGLLKETPEETARKLVAATQAR